MIDNIQWQTAIEYEAMLLYCCILSLLFYLMITFVYLVGGAYILATSFWLGNFFIIIGLYHYWHMGCYNTGPFTITTE